jgi:hypothetical protein
MKNYDTLMGEAYARGYRDGAESVPTGFTIEPLSPLSGEWAGESIPELFGLDIGEQYDDSVIEDYEQQYSDGFLAGLAE